MMLKLMTVVEKKAMIRFLGRQCGDTLLRRPRYPLLRAATARRRLIEKSNLPFQEQG